MSESNNEMTQTSPPEAGWWQASDGNWYPPESAQTSESHLPPPPSAAASPQGGFSHQVDPAPKKSRKKWLVGIPLALVAAAAAAVGVVLATSESNEPDAAEGTAVEEATETDPVVVAPLVATEASLLNAIPAATELPPGWADLGWGGGTDLVPRRGPGFGFCSGPNADKRAIEANVVAHAYQDGWQTDVNGQVAWLSLYAFENEEDAAAFMASTERAVSSCSSEELNVHEWVEGRDENVRSYRVDNMAEDAEPDEPWELFETSSLGGAAAEGADEAFFIKNTEVFLGYQGNTSFGITDGIVVQYERHGTVVAVLGLTGNCCVFGFSNTDSHDEDELPQYADLKAAADYLRPVILADVFTNVDL